MPLTHSRENLVDLEEPSNVSFTVDMGAGDSLQTGPNTRARVRNRTQISNTQDITENSVRQMINDSMSGFREEFEFEYFK